MSHGTVVWLCDLDYERLDRWATSLASTRPEQLHTEAHTQRAGGYGVPRGGGNGVYHEAESPSTGRRDRTMKATYDLRTDSLTVILKENAAIAESDEDKPGVILDYDEHGNLVSLEILDASRRVTKAHKMEFQTTES